MKLTRPDEDAEEPRSKIQRCILQQWQPGLQSRPQSQQWVVPADQRAQSQEWVLPAGKQPEGQEKVLPTNQQSQDWTPSAAILTPSSPAMLEQVIRVPGESQESFLARRLHSIQAKQQDEESHESFLARRLQAIQANNQEKAPSFQLPVPVESHDLNLARQRASEILSTIAKAKGFGAAAEMRQKMSEMLAMKMPLGGNLVANDGEEADNEVEAEPPALLGTPESELIGDFHWFDFPQDERDPGGGADAEHLPLEAFHEQRSALQTLVLALGVDVPQDSRMEEALMAEATRFLHAVLGFAGEGAVSDAARARAISVASTTFAGHGLAVVPVHMHARAVDAMLGQWFEHPLLIGIFAKDAIRAAFDRSQSRYRAQFVCALGRVLLLEALRNGCQNVRREWKEVLDAFPEVEQLAALLRHVKRRCWEDVRDRSKSRSRSREKKKGDSKPKLPKDAIRFVVKKAGDSDEMLLTAHFARFGKICELTLLRDKKTQKPRGVAFVTLQPQGIWQGIKNTKESMRQWVLGEKHLVRGGRALEVTEAEMKPQEDEATKREERVEERRKMREQRGKTGGEQRFVLSPWARNWRQKIFAVLPQEAESHTDWSNPRLRRICRTLWTEATDHVSRCGDETAQGALSFFRSEAGWCFIPAVDCLLSVAEGFFGSLVDGVFKSNVDGPGKPELQDHSPDLMTAVALVKAIRHPVQTPVTVQQALSGGSRQQWPSQDESTPSTMCWYFQQGTCTNGASCKFSHGQEQSSSPAGRWNEAKIFVGGLTQDTTLEMLRAHFGKYGELTDAVVMKDETTGNSRGFGFVVFASEASVDSVMNEYTNHQIDGKWVEVKTAAPRDMEGEKDTDKTSTMCYFFQQGQCTNGSACKFSHGPGTAAPSQDTSPAVTLCYYFQRGECVNGAACEYSHG